MPFNPLKTKQTEDNQPMLDEDYSEENTEVTTNNIVIEEPSSSGVMDFFQEEGVVDKNKKIDFLQPKKSAKKDSHNDSFMQKDLENSAYQHTLRLLNGIKVISPIMNALMLNPGSDSTKEEMSKTFKNIVLEITDISGKICEKLEIDITKEKNLWIRNVLERTISELINQQWVKNNTTDISNIIPLIDSIVEYSNKVSNVNYYEDIPVDSYLKIAGIKAMSPILVEATNFSLYRNIDNDLEFIMDKLFNASKEATKKLANEYADEKERAKIFFMLMQEAGVLYANAWNNEANKIKKIVEQYTEEKLKNVIEKHKSNGGLSLNKINAEFDKYFSRLVVISDKLIMSHKSGMSNKFKS